MKYQVFLSHNTKDKGLVSDIRKALEKAQVDVYLAEKDLQPGKNLPNKIIQSIESSHCMVVLLTHLGNRSQFVNQEIGAARIVNKPIIPMVEKKIEGKIGGLLSGLEYISFDKRKPQEAINELVSYLSNLKTKWEAKIRNQEDTAAIIAIVAIVVFAVIILYFASRKK